MYFFLFMAQLKNWVGSEKKHYVRFFLCVVPKPSHGKEMAHCISSKSSSNEPPVSAGPSSKCRESRVFWKQVGERWEVIGVEFEECFTGISSWKIWYTMCLSPAFSTWIKWSGSYCYFGMCVSCIISYYVLVCSYKAIAMLFFVIFWKKLPNKKKIVNFHARYMPLPHAISSVTTIGTVGKK